MSENDLNRISSVDPEAPVQGAEQAAQEQSAPQMQDQAAQRNTDRSEAGQISDSGNTVHEKHRKKLSRKEKRSRKRWRLFVFFYTIAFILIGLTACNVLYQFLDRYEQSLPENTMDTLMEQTSDDQWLSYMLADQNVKVSSFDNEEQILRDYFELSCKGKTFAYSEAISAESDGNKVYNIKAGNAYMCRVTLSADRELSFGFHTWKVSDISTYIPEGSLASVTIRIEAPQNTEILVNGTVLDESYVIDPSIQIVDLTDLEKRYSTQPVRVLYEVSGLYGSVSVTLADGSEVTPEADQNVDPDSEAAVFYSVPSPTYAFEVTAPADVEVFCNGVELSDNESVKTVKGILDGLETYTGGKTDAIVTYSVEGLYQEPDITASAVDGTELVESIDASGKITFVYKEDASLKEKYESTADEFFSDYISYSAGNESSYDPLLEDILPDTDLYTYVEDSTAAMIWASDTSVDFEYLDYTDFRQWSDQCFTCRVSYKASLTATTWYETNSYDLENVYDLVFVQKDDQWLCAVMSIVE